MPKNELRAMRQDGATSRPALLGVQELASILVFGGFMPAQALDDPDGFDDGRMMEKVGYVCELLNARLTRRFDLEADIL